MSKIAVIAFGGNVLNEDGTGYVYNSQPTIDAMTFIKELYDDGCAYFFTEGFPNPEFAARRAIFTQGSSSGLPFYMGDIATMAEETGTEPDEWSITAIPHTTADPTIDIIGWGDSGWAARLAEIAGEELQYIAFHNGLRSGGEGSPLYGVEYRKDPDKTWAYFMKTCKAQEAKLKDMRSQVAKYNIPLALTECHYFLPGRNRCDTRHSRVASTHSSAVRSPRSGSSTPNSRPSRTTSSIACSRAGSRRCCCWGAGRGTYSRQSSSSRVVTYRPR